MCAILRRDTVTVEVEVEGGYGATEEVEETVFVFVGGASLISPGVVLTGAHKVEKYSEPGSLVVRCGEWDTQTESEIKTHQDRNVSRMILHPEFNPRNLWNSIAVLFLETDFVLDQHIDTICLPEYQQNFDDRSECFVKVRSAVSQWLDETELFIVSGLGKGALRTRGLLVGGDEGGGGADGEPGPVPDLAAQHQAGPEVPAPLLPGLCRGRGRP